MGLFTKKKKPIVEEDRISKKGRKYSVKVGLDEDVLKRLRDLYDYLHMDELVGRDGFVITNYKEMVDMTNVSNNDLGALLKKEIILKRSERGKPGYKFKYSWVGKYPTKEMANMIINMTFRSTSKKSKSNDPLVDDDKQLPEPEFKKEPEIRDDTVSEDDMRVRSVSEMEQEKKKLTANPIPIEMNTMEKVEESFDSSINSPIEYKKTGDHLFIRVNLSLFNIEEKTIIASIMKTLLGES